MSMKKKFNILLLLLVALSCFHTAVVGQVSPYQLSPKWKFGNNNPTGFSFTGTPPAVNLSFISGSTMNAEEMTSTICDTAGNIVCYSNNRLVAGSNDAIISTLLDGSTSSTNGPIIIPDPADRFNSYYLFVGNAERGVAAPNGGNGNGIWAYRVTKSGTSVTATLVSTIALADYGDVNEALYVSSDADNEGYWLIAHARSGTNYYSWHITATGIGPKVTSSGTISVDAAQFQATIKINKCQDRIAFVAKKGEVEVYTWNKTTGQVGTQLAHVTVALGRPDLYAGEFSPNGEMFYFSGLVGAYDGNKLFQLNIGTNSYRTDPSWVSSNTGPGWNEMGSLQLGPDGKIYVAMTSHNSTSYVGVISNPDSPTATFNNRGVTLPSGQRTYRGIANIAWLNPNKPVIKNTDIKTCPNDYTFAYDFRTYFNKQISVVTETWDFGDGSAIVNGANPVHTYKSKNVDTTYLVKLTLIDGSCNQSWKDSMYVTVKACSQKVIPETPVCAGATSAFVKVTDVKANEVYQVVKPDGTIIDGPVTVTADEDTLRMSVSQPNLTPGLINNFKVQVKRSGATAFVDMEDNADIDVKDKPKTDQEVWTLPQPQCSDTAIVKLFKAETGAVYTVRIDQIAYPAITPATNSDTLIFTLPDLSVGTHDISFNVTFSACIGTFPLDDSVKVTIVGKPDTTLEISAISPLCLEPGTTATVKVHNPEKDLVYQVTYQGKPVSTAETTTSAGAIELSLTIPYDTLVKIGNTPSITPPLYVFNVTVTTPCHTKTLLDTAGIYIAIQAKEKVVTATPEPVCIGDTVYIKIAAADTAVTYTVLNESFKLRNPGDTTIKVLAKAPLVVGLNTISVSGKVEGCPVPVPVGKVDFTIIDLPDTTLEVSAVSPLCLAPGTTATIKVKNPEKDLTYQVTYQGKPVSNPEITVTAGDTELNLTIPYDTLVKIRNTASTTPPLYVFSVTVTTPCHTKTLLDTAGIFLAIPVQEKIVTATPDPVCKGDTIYIKIAAADTAVTYTVLNESFKLRNPGDTIVKVLANTPLVAGANIIVVNGEVSGCGLKEVGRDTVEVNIPVDPNITYSIDSICVNHDAVIVINSPQTDVTYTAYLDGDLTSAKSGTSSIVFDKAYFNAGGKYGVLITGTPLPGCPVDTLHQRDTVKVVELDKTKLVSKDTIVVCANGDKAVVQIYDPQPAVTYSYGSSSVKAPSVATDSIQLAIPVSALADGLNNIRIDIANTICNDTLLAHAFILKINQVKGIIGDTLICRTNKYEFQVSPLVAGAKSYTWWTKHNAVLSDPVKLGSGDSARVTFDFAAVVQDTDVVYVSVNGDSICTFPPYALKVHMFDPLSGLILKDDTICADAYGPDSVRYIVAPPVSNAPKYLWVIKNGPNGAIVNYNTFTDAGIPDSSGSVIIAFPPVAGTVDSIGVDLEVIPYSVCLKDYDVSKAVVKHITILPTPDVNAGRDIDTVNATFPQIILDGTTMANGRPSSSLNPASGKQVYQYSWVPKETGSYIESPDKIRTQLVSQSEEQNTYVLTVWNRGKCAVSDEVNIRIQLTVNPSNAFTPNGDGRNDVWEIRNLEYFPNNTLVIYNQWGSKVYEASPYHNNWAGTHNGEDLPIGTYYYVLDLRKANIAPMAGSITIVK